jgi:hypothetical protein
MRFEKLKLACCWCYNRANDRASAAVFSISLLSFQSAGVGFGLAGGCVAAATVPTESIASIFDIRPQYLLTGTVS